MNMENMEKSMVNYITTACLEQIDQQNFKSKHSNTSDTRALKILVRLLVKGLLILLRGVKHITCCL